MESGKPLSRKSVISYPSKIKEDFFNKTLKTKLQWIYRFLKRYDFSIRQVSHKGQSISDCKDNIKKIY